MDNDELIHLLAQCALRDQKALQRLYSLTSAYLNAVAYRIVGSRECSNEVLQDAFVQIWDNAGNYAPSQALPLTWMSTIVRYRAIDKVRKEKRHNNRLGSEDEEEIMLREPGGEEPDLSVEEMCLTQEMENCLDQMNEKFKESIKLAYIYGYSREELVGILGANLNTVKSWLRRGSIKLKECLQSNYEQTTNK